MALLKMGSSGSDVKKLQEQLNGAGYKLDTDGVYGQQTANAVKQYQKANGLSVDGIVGDQTWGKLNGGGMTAPESMPAPETPKATTNLGNSYDPTMMTGNMADLNAIEGGAPTFQQSQALTDALNALQAQTAQKPVAYVSPYQDQLAALYDKAMNRTDFSYDPNADPIYQMYKDRYTQNARQGMEESMANAAALTGGYGNTYAAAVGQQMYDETMSGLNDILPQLYSQRRAEYDKDNQDVIDQLNLTMNMDNNAYGRYADQLADYYKDLGVRADLAGDQYNREYNVYQDALNKWLTDRNYYAGKVADDAAAEAAAAKSSGGGSGGGSKSGSGGSGTGGDYKSILKTAQGMSEKNAYAYIARMVDNGYITSDQGMRMLEMELGIDPSKYATGGSESNAVKAATGAGAAANVYVDPNKVRKKTGSIASGLSKLIK